MIPALEPLYRTDIPMSSGRTAVYAYKPGMEKGYTFDARYDDEVVPLFRRDGNLIHFPRELCQTGSIDGRDPGEPVKFPMSPTPRDNQLQAFKATKTFLLAGLSGIVSAYTGFGKTLLGYHAAAVLGVKTIVITTKDDIFAQWYDGAKEFLGLDDMDVGIIRGDECQVVGTKFVVAMVQSLSKVEKYPEWVTKGFGLVIFDECHRMSADQFRNVVDMFPAKWRLGLSATIDRGDGKHPLFMAHIGPIRYVEEGELMIPKVFRFTSSWVCPRVPREDPQTKKLMMVRVPHEPGRTTHIEKMLAVHDARNRQLADMIATAYRKGRQTVAFSTTHLHLEQLKPALVKAGIPGKEVGLYVGANTKAAKAKRVEMAAKLPILLTTYVMMAEGTDIERLDTAVIAMPRSDVRQPAGRVRRQFENKRFPLVMDLMDPDSWVFVNYAASRMQWYKSIGCEVTDY